MTSQKFDDAESEWDEIYNSYAESEICRTAMEALQDDDFEAGVDEGFDDYAYERNRGQRAFEASHNMTDLIVELYAHERTCRCPQCDGEPQ